MRIFVNAAHPLWNSSDAIKAAYRDTGRRLDLSLCIVASGRQSGVIKMIRE